MRPLALLLTLLIASAAAAQTPAAQNAPPPEEQPDFSRDTLLRLLADNPEREEAERRVKIGIGTIDFRLGGVRWRVGYLPFFMPLQGSMPWVNGHRWPDPFVLTGTEIAHTSRTWKDDRALSAEVRRLERRLRESATVKVTTEP